MLAQVCLHITESMLLLSGGEMLEAHGSALGHMCMSVLGHVKDAATLIMIEGLGFRA